VPGRFGMGTDPAQPLTGEVCAHWGWSEPPQAVDHGLQCRHAFLR
jgi:hypothetical protein